MKNKNKKPLVNDRDRNIPMAVAFLVVSDNRKCFLFLSK